MASGGILADHNASHFLSNGVVLDWVFKLGDVQQARHQVRRAAVQRDAGRCQFGLPGHQQQKAIGLDARDGGEDDGARLERRSAALDLSGLAQGLHLVIDHFRLAVEVPAVFRGLLRVHPFRKPRGRHCNLKDLLSLAPLLISLGHARPHWNPRGVGVRAGQLAVTRRDHRRAAQPLALRTSPDHFDELQINLWHHRCFRVCSWGISNPFFENKSFRLP
mmetsp:Transcript_15084/g.26761  ORF Transcript_15084/g.26761 Transcript_15084/m.26761 type:complete len:219 (+) Transcript_15084:303-959(+)